MYTSLEWLYPFIPLGSVRRRGVAGPELSSKEINEVGLPTTT